MMTVAAAALALGARAEGADVQFTSVSTDTRTLQPGALFVALRGERFDGHDYLDRARAAGAVAAMVEVDAAARAAAAGLAAVVVAGTRRALGTLAKHWRAGFRIPLIAVVGSNGKTTVKEMIAACLRAHFGAANVLATAGNLNNDVGVPLTLLGLRAPHRCAVVELGMNHPGETEYLAGLAQPTVAVINNAQREHQEFMKTVAEVAAEHAAVLRALPADGVAVINAEDDHAGYWRGVAGARPVRDFAVGRKAAVRGAYRPGAEGAEVEIIAPEGRVSVALHVAGLHNVRNALAAAAAATAAGAALAAVASGLASFRAVKGRLQRRIGRQGATVIDDTYNANPDSVRVAIDVLAQAGPPRILVLGDMGELGPQASAFHEEVGAYALQSGIDRLFAVGALARHAADAFGAGAEHFESTADAARRLQGLLAPGVTVLVKGSRFMRMETVVGEIAPEVDRAA